MFEAVRGWGRKLQAKYEAIIESRSLFGFSEVYADAMQRIKKRQQRDKL